MSYTIDFSAVTDPIAKQNAAIEAAKTYLGDQFTRIIEMFTQAVKSGEFVCRKQVYFAMSFVGIHGYPVDALIERYWPSLPESAAAIAVAPVEE